MSKRRRIHSDEFKAKVALEAIKEVRTLSELSSIFGVHPTVIAHWKMMLIQGAPALFGLGAGVNGKSEEEMTRPLYEQIGRLQMEVDWLKKKV